MQDIEKILNLTHDELEALPTETLVQIKSLLDTSAALDETEQKSLKLMINSLYGAQANKHFVMANPDLAAAVTASGRFFIQLMAIVIEEKLQELLPSVKPYLVYGDTDSCYYHIEPFVTKKFGENAQPTSEVIDWIDRFEKQIIQACIAETIDRYGEILNVYDKDPIGVEREMISDSAVFVAKKKYFARVMDMEGVRYDLEDPYIKVMGLEVAKSGTSKWVKEKLKESIGVILDKDARGLQEWRDKTKMEFSSQKIDDICTIQGISNLQYNLGDKGIPQGSKSALVHNKWVKDNGLEDEIPLLTAGEKYKRCYLLQPNRFGSEIISFDSDRIAKIIEEDGIYDYATNFEKQFEKPLENMVECLGYDLTNKPKFDLEDW